jgi:uroporphyrin-3 C-methyltransferase
MNKKTTPKPNATNKTSKKKSVVATKKAAEKKLELEAEVAKEPRASDPPADEPRAESPSEKPASAGPRFETPHPEPQQSASRSGAFSSRLALVLSLGALIGMAYLVFDNWRTSSSTADSDAAMASIDKTLNATRDSLEGLEQRLDSVASRDVASVGDLQSTERRLNERLARLESLPARVGNLERSMTALQGISTGARDKWLLSEAEYYMQIANAQLQLAGNPNLASLALGFADERLLQMADPALTEVRRALSDELRALEAMEKPDIEGVTLTLASLASVVDSLPLRQEVHASDGETDGIDPELSGLDRALASLKRAVRDVVSVRRTDEAAMPLTAPDAVYFLRANLALQLQAARLALLRGEKEIFEQSLDDAAAWLTRYYDTEGAPVQSALETIAEMRGGVFSIAPPDISESLRLLRQHVALSGIEPD